MSRTRGKSAQFTYCACGGQYKNPSEESSPLICRLCEKPSHKSCTCYDGAAEDFECSLCRVQSLDPFNSVVEYLWYGRLGNDTTVLKIDTTCLDKWLSQNKDVYVVSLPLNKSKLMHEWPRTLELKINNEVVHVVKEPSWEHTRRDNPIKVTYAMRQGENVIEMLTTTYSSSGPFFLVVFMVSKSVTVDRMIEKIKKRRTIPLDICKERIIKLIDNTSEDDEVICLEKDHKIDLNCPITLYRITLPARGKNCRHLQCFDLSGYLHVMQNTSTFNTRWRCPECELFIKPCDLVIDEYVLSILEATPPNISTVKLDMKGNYEWVNAGDLFYSKNIQVDLAASDSFENPSAMEGEIGFTDQDRSKVSKATNSFLDSAVTASFDGVCVKRETLSDDKKIDVIELDDDEDTENTSIVGFKNGEVINLDGGCDEAENGYIVINNSSSITRPSATNVKTKPNIYESDERPSKPTLSPLHKSRMETRKRSSVRPSETLSQRLTQLPRISGTHKVSRLEALP